MADTISGTPSVDIAGAEASFQKNQLEEAEAICRTLLEESERNIRAMLLMAKIMLRRYRPDEGVQYLEKAIQTDPKYVLAYKLLAEVYYNKGELSKAIEQYKKVLEIDPMDIDSHKKLQDLSSKVPPASLPLQKTDDMTTEATPPSPHPISPLPTATESSPSTVAPPTNGTETIKTQSRAEQLGSLPKPLPTIPVTAATVSPSQPSIEKTEATTKPASQKEVMDLIKSRITTLSPKIKTIIDKNLAEIREISGVLGSILINKEGLTIGSSLSRGMEIDRELVGALSLSIYKATNSAVASLDQGELNQVTLQTKDKIMTIFNSEEFILTTVLQKNANLGLVRLENGRCIHRIKEHLKKEMS